MATQRRKRTYGSVGKFIRRLRKPKAELRIFDPAQTQPLPISDEELASKKFFCIRGHMKSGTNWIGNLLRLHPEISCIGEFHWHRIAMAIEETIARVDWLQQDAVRRADLERQFERVMKRTVLSRADRSATWVGERTPGPLLPLAFPHAPQIRIVRDGRDVLVSRVFHFLNRCDNGPVRKEIERDPVLKQQWLRHQADRDYFDRHPHELLRSERFVRRAARAWHECLDADRQAIDRFADMKLLTIRYEQLHQDVEQGRRAMMDFLGANAELAAPLDELTRAGFTSRTRLAAKPGEPDFDKEAYQDELFYRRGQVGDWKHHMTRDAQRWFVEEAGDELIRQGYAATHHW